MGTTDQPSGVCIRSLSRSLHLKLIKVLAKIPWRKSHKRTKKLLHKHFSVCVHANTLVQMALEANGKRAQWAPESSRPRGISWGALAQPFSCSCTHCKGGAIIFGTPINNYIKLSHIHYIYSYIIYLYIMIINIKMILEGSISSWDPDKVLG